MPQFFDAPLFRSRVYFNLGMYHSQYEINNYLYSLASSYRDIVQEVRSIGAGHEGRQIMLIKVLGRGLLRLRRAVCNKEQPYTPSQKLSYRPPPSTKNLKNPLYTKVIKVGYL